jgi:outer membrane biosynthesis protein TonB
MTPSGLALLGLWLALPLLVACSGAAASNPSANATVEALNAQVVQLNRQVEQLQPTATSVPTVAPPTRPPTVEPTEEPTATPEPEPTSAPEPTQRVFPTRTPRPILASDAAPCALGQVKGNRSSKIYHVPGGGSYSQTKANVQCFDTEAQAQAAGFRRARN